MRSRRVEAGIGGGVGAAGRTAAVSRSAKWTVGGWLLCVALGVVLVAPLDAQQAPRWTLGAGDATTTFPEHRDRGFAALPITALQALGAELDAVAGGVRLRIGGREAVLRDGLPFVRIDGELRQLVEAPYMHGGALHVPVQFVVDHLPRLLGGAIAVDLDSRIVRREAGDALAPPPVAARPEPAPAARPPAPAAPAAEPPPAPAVRQEAPPPPTTPPVARPAAARRLVVIDPGHGGVDPGAIGPGGIREKDVALAVSRRLAEILRDDPTLEVRMTRERDTLIALTDRTRMANRWRGEGQPALFMSIHTNAHDRSSVRGFETFFLSDARTEDARRVAAMENAAQRYENPGRELDPISFILHDLRQNRYLRDSSEWAAMVQRRLASVHPGPNRGVKQAGFVVLNGAFMPAVLVELGFITHPEEERMLTSAGYQERLARQLAAAVDDFFQQAQAPTAP